MAIFFVIISGDPNQLPVDPNLQQQQAYADPNTQTAVPPQQSTQPQQQPAPQPDAQTLQDPNQQFQQQQQAPQQPDQQQLQQPTVGFI